MTPPILMLVLRAVLLAAVVFISLAITALQASTSPMATLHTTMTAQGRHKTEFFYNNPHTSMSEFPEAADESLSDSTTVSVDAQALLPVATDPKAHSDALASEAKKFLERVPSLHTSTVESVAPSSISSDGPLRHHLDADTKAGTDWKSLAEHALQERDMYKQLAQNLPPLSSFDSHDLVLNPTRKWTAPVHRSPACVVSKLNASNVCPTTDQSSLIGTLLLSAKDTVVGSIMPTSEFHKNEHM